jgi:hypothetical protein
MVHLKDPMIVPLGTRAVIVDTDLGDLVAVVERST